MGYGTNVSINMQKILSFIKQRLLVISYRKNINFNNKQNSFGVYTLRRYKIKPQNIKKYFKFKQEVSFGLLYLITKLEEKQEFLVAQNMVQDTILGLRNFFLQKGKNKIKKKSGWRLSTLLKLYTVYYNFKEKKIKYNYKSLYRSELFTILNEISNHTLLTLHTPSFWFNKNINRNKINKKQLNSNLWFKNYQKLWKFRLKKQKINKQKLYRRLYWKQKKLINIKSNLSLKNINKYFSVFLGEKVSIIFINALALTKFAHVYPMKKRNVQRFINYIEREMIQRYKYVAIYIQDFVRICYLSFFLKKPTFIANFMGYQLAYLPRNRKETRFIRFLIKVLKIFGAYRPEVTAIKVEFKGRVNRWRRTKIIRGTSGIISFFKFNMHIEFGNGKSITRKGALGIRLWICYKGIFMSLFKERLLKYIEYSQLYRAKIINRLLSKFKSKKKIKIKK